MVRLRLAVLVAVLVMPFSVAVVQADGPELRLGPDETRKEARIQTEDGEVRLTIEGDRARPAKARGREGDVETAASWGYYTRTCSGSVRGVGSVWKLSVYSTFYYDFSSIWQAQPSVASQAIWPYTWSNKSAWNTAWNPTTAFADAQGDLNSYYVFQTTWRVYIGEDAWGNCWIGAYRP